MSSSIAGIIKKDNKFLLGKRKPGGSIGGKWEFPGGKVEKNETLEQALIREFKEELDCKITINSFITTEEFQSSDHHFILNAFYIDLNDSEIKHNEHEEFRWFTLEEIYELNDRLADSDKLILKSL